MDFAKLPFFRYSEWISTVCAYKEYVVTWNDKSGGKCGRFSEEYLTSRRFYKTI